MKELSIEEKAKRYDEALATARKLYNEAKANGYTSDIEDYETIFPELKESEDEKIRKRLLELFKEHWSEEWYGLKVKDVISWLEKQVPACLSHDDEIMIRQLTEYFTTGKGLQNTNDTVVEWLTDVKRKLEQQGEQKPQRMISAGAKEAMYDKPAWSEEDEEELKIALDTLEKAGQHSSATWLKNVCLVPQSHWKPSEKQMKILNEVLSFAANHESPYWNDYIFGTLSYLIRQLKKLREE